MKNSGAELRQDHEIMLSVREGNIQELGQLFDRYSKRLYNYFRLQVKDRLKSEDLVQNVFYNILRYRHTYKVNADFKAWMYTIARNEKINFFKKNKPLDVEIDTELPDEKGNNPENDFEHKWYHSTDFSLVSPSIKEYSKPKQKGNLALILMGIMILAVTTGIVNSMLVAAAITAGVMIMTKIISYGDAKHSIDFDVLIVIASAFGIGQAIANSGIADIIANTLISSLDGYGIIAIIAGLFFITSLYTEIITNNAAAALIFPIALSTATQMHLDPKPFMITIAIAASASFATPIGYQTNLMVYGPGGYNFKDFFKIGLPLTIIYMVVTISILSYMYFPN